MNHYISKPVDEDIVAAVLTKWLDPIGVGETGDTVSD